MTPESPLSLTPPESIPCDDHAIRLGHPAVGHIVVMPHQEGTDPFELRVEIANQLFLDEAEARAYGSGIAPRFHPTIKTLRASAARLEEKRKLLDDVALIQRGVDLAEKREKHPSYAMELRALQQMVRDLYKRLEGW